MKPIRLAALLASLLMLSFCGGSGKTKADSSESKPSAKTSTQKQSSGMSAYDEEGIPAWFNEPPKDKQFFFFAGVGRGQSEAGAKNAAQADIFSQIVFMVSASVTANTSFEQYVEENETSAKRNSALYKKVRSKGDAVIENFEIDQQFSQKSEEKEAGFNFYMLAKIPKSEIQKARERAEAEKAEKRANPMAVFAVAVFPDNRIETLDTIQGELENLYKSMGYNIQAVSTEFDSSVFASSGKLTGFLKKAAYPKVKKALICVMKSSQIRKETLGKNEITSLKGDMTIREVNLETGEVMSAQTYEGKGVSMRKDASAPEDAFKKLINSLTVELLSEGDEGRNEY